MNGRGGIRLPGIIPPVRLTPFCMFQTGALARSISVDATDTSGFVITADAEYAGYMQNSESAGQRSPLGLRFDRRMRCWTTLTM
jgi:hypothetical protein